MSYYQLFLDYMSNENVLEKQSKCYLSKTECACCHEEFFEDPHGMFIISETYKDLRSDHRYYFPICQIVCEECYKLLDSKYYDNTNVDISDYDTPLWSRVNLFLTYCQIRPSGLCLLDDFETLGDVLLNISYNTDGWDEYNEISFGELEEELDN